MIKINNPTVATIPYHTTPCNEPLSNPSSQIQIICMQPRVPTEYYHRSSEMIYVKVGDCALVD